MTEISRVSLMNEMDAEVASKRMISVAKFFSPLLSTQTAIATAVAEVCRIVIDKTNRGWLSIGMETGDDKFSLIGRVGFPTDTDIGPSEKRLKVVQRLVPGFLFYRNDDIATISVSIEMPRSPKITQTRLNEAVELFRPAQPIEPYDVLKDDFISAVSHELKTPLTSIMAFTELALHAGTTETPANVQHYLERIDLQVHKLHDLIKQLLDASRIESGNLPYQIQNRGWNAYMTEMMPMLEQLAPSHRLRLRPCSVEVMVPIDVLRIEQVLTNLVGNAAKYSNPDSLINIRCSSNTNNLTVCICDQGIGISKQNRNRLFEKYFRDETVSGKYSGFGMGLYISSGILQKHKGSIWAEKNEGAGSSFYFTLPICKV